MRFPLFVALSLVSVPAAAQQSELGARTQAPDTMVSGLRLAPGEDDLQQAIAEAETHPLGTLANPIRVGGPDGERAYLARLRCADGSGPRIGAHSNGGVDPYGTVTSAYRVECVSGSAQLFFDMYHEEHVEDRAPAGLTLVAH